MIYIIYYMTSKVLQNKKRYNNKKQTQNINVENVGCNKQLFLNDTPTHK